MTAPSHRIRLTFAALVVVATIALGVLGQVLAWSPSPVAGFAVAASGLVAVAAGGLAVRILVVTDRNR